MIITRGIMNNVLPLVTRGLGNDALVFQLLRFIAEEQYSVGTANITLTVRVGAREVTLRGTGKGALDALCQAFQSAYSSEHPSLRGIQFKSFQAVNVPSTGARGGSGADAQASVTVVFSTSQGEAISFQTTAASVNAASCAAVIEAFQFFINAERAYRKISDAIKDARRRDRADLIQGYQGQLATLVQWINYEGVVSGR
ncbi:MAG: hypothetical protein KBD15_03955 [Candidatus Magasanikbacteria bacterium]|nr:hypothetical protein [Candidatus Magasanikbacteria bacterium]